MTDIAKLRAEIEAAIAVLRDVTYSTAVHYLTQGNEPEVVSTVTVMLENALRYIAAIEQSETRP